MDTVHIDAGIHSIYDYTNKKQIYLHTFKKVKNREWYKKVKTKKEPGCSSTPSEAYKQGERETE